MSKTIATLFALVLPAQAYAHGAPVLHDHPHGATALPGFEALAVLAVIVLAGLASRHAVGRNRRALARRRASSGRQS